MTSTAPTLVTLARSGNGCTGFLASYQDKCFLVTARHCHSFAKWATIGRKGYDLEGERFVALPGDNPPDVGFVTLNGNKTQELARMRPIVLPATKPDPPEVTVLGFADPGQPIEATLRRTRRRCGVPKACSCCEPAGSWPIDTDEGIDYSSYECADQISGSCLDGGNSGSVALAKDDYGQLYGVVPARGCSNVALIPLFSQKELSAGIWPTLGAFLGQCVLQNGRNCPGSPIKIELADRLEYLIWRASHWLRDLGNARPR